MVEAQMVMFEVQMVIVEVQTLSGCLPIRQRESTGYLACIFNWLEREWGLRTDDGCWKEQLRVS